jgi:hypothetical protein
MTKHQDNWVVKKIGLPKTWHVHHHEANKHSGIPIQASRFHEGPPTFHVSLLEPYHVSTIPRRTHKLHPLIVIDGEQEYEVEKILDLRISHRQL